MQYLINSVDGFQSGESSRLINKVVTKKRINKHQIEKEIKSYEKHKNVCQLRTTIRG